MARKKALNSFTVNGKTYVPRDFDFNAICEFDKMGISIDSIAKNQFASARAYLALYNNNDEVWAGNEIQAHVINGGDLTGILTAFAESLTKSGFFQAIKTNAEKKRGTGEAESEEAVE